MSLIMDACDQNDVDCPYFRDKPKDWQNGQRLSIKMCAIMFHGTDQRPPAEATWRSAEAAQYLYPVDQRTTKGMDLWCTALTDALGRYRDEIRGGRLAEVLYIQADSASDNKNYTVASFTEWLVRRGIFQKVKMSFLPVGHTHEDIDAGFGRLSKTMHHLASRVCRTWSEVADAARKATKQFKSITALYVRLCLPSGDQ